MATIRVSVEEVRALGSAVADVAVFVASIPDAVRSGAWACGPGETADALAELVGNWEHQRHVLGRGLNALAQAALTAGGGYATVEEETTRLMSGGRW